MKKKIFREASLERLSSPEQLDRLVTITDRRGWLALAMLILLLISLGWWSVVGSIPTNVVADGLLISKGGQVADAMTPAAGSLTDIRVEVGQAVEKGEVLAVIDQTGIRQRLKSAQEVVAERHTEYDRLKQSNEREIDLKKRNFSKRRKAIQASIAASTQRRKNVQHSLKLQEQSSKKGYIPRQKVEETRTELNTVKQLIADGRNDILRLEADELDLVSERAKQLEAAERRINEAKRQVRELQSQLNRDSSVRAPVAGRVTEIKLAQGSVVAQGLPVMSIEKGGDGLLAVAYVPTAQGKRVKQTMRVLIEPSTVRREEHGSLVGKVVSVSEFPVSRQGMAAVLQNDELVDAFFANGPPYEVRVELIAAPDNPSGYRWTSAGGPDIRISSGTTVRAEVTVSERRPIELVLPVLKKTAGLD